MNSLNEIIVSFENEKKENSIQHNNSEENYKKEKIYDESHITFLLYHLYENLGKKFYKKALKEIDTLFKTQDIDKYKDAWKIYILRIRAQLKVVKRKIEKYLISYAERMKFKNKINGIKKYLNQVLENLNIFIDKFSVSKREETIEKVNALLRCYFEYIYLNCIFNKKLDNINEILPYLSILVNLYNKTKLIFKSDRTLFKLEKCFFLLIQMLICNEDYILAINYINIITEICLYHIIYSTKDLSEGIFIDDKKKVIILENKESSTLSRQEQEIETENLYGNKNMKKIIFHLIFLFYYRGMCYESIGKINYSIKSYYQCLWFHNKFFYNGYNRISILFKKTVEKSLELKRTVDFIIKKIKAFDRIQFFLDKQREKKKSEEDKDVMYDNLLNGIKLKKLENKLTNLNISEVDTVNPFDIQKRVRESDGRKREGIYKNIFMSDTRLLNSYLREDFRPIIDKMDKIKTFDIDISTREKIQKLLRGVYFEQSQKELKQKNRSKIQNMKSNFTINITKNKNLISSISLVNENKNMTSNKNDIMQNNYIKINNKKSIDRKEILSLDKSKKRLILAPNSVQQYSSQNNTNFFIPAINKVSRPKSSFPAESRIPSGTKKIQRFSTPMTGARNYLEYKSKTMSSQMGKQKYLNSSKNYKRIRAQSAKLFRKIPTEDKSLNRFFNKKYLNKRNYIKMLEDRDLKFQKSILKIKKEQKSKNEVFTKDLMKQNADELFQRVMGIYLSSSSDWNKAQTVDKNSKLNEKLIDALISSLDNAAIIKYNIQKDKERNKSRPITDQMNLSAKNINAINNNFIKNLDNKIEEIKQREIIENKTFQRIINNNQKYIRLRDENEKSNKNKFNRTTLNPSFKPDKGFISCRNENSIEYYLYNRNNNRYNNK